jgi:hypothetical protein
MADRLALQALLVDILGSSNVYFQPPSNITMQYDCIRYELDDIQPKHAGNKPYSLADRYSVTYICRDPDSAIIKELASLPKCLFERSYQADNLNHYVYNLFF